MKCYDKSLKISPDYFDAWAEKGASLHRLKKYKEAIKCYDKAIKIDSQVAFIWYYKGLSLFAIKQYGEAAKCAKKALALDPGYEYAKELKKACSSK